MYKKGIKYKCRKDLQICKPKELESASMEINQKDKKLIVGSTYRHPSMDLFELTIVTFYQFSLKSSPMKIKPQFLS